MSPQILALDAARRETLTSAQAIQTERNQLSKEIGVRKSKGEDASDILAAVANRNRDLVMTWRGKIGRMLKLMSPALVDRIAKGVIESRQ